MAALSPPLVESALEALSIGFELVDKEADIIPLYVVLLYCLVSSWRCRCCFVVMSWRSAACVCVVSLACRRSSAISNKLGVGGTHPQSHRWPWFKIGYWFDIGVVSAGRSGLSTPFDGKQ